jgi:hypothetical protein
MRIFFALFVVTMALYLGVMFVPVYYSEYEFEDAIKSEALFATNSSNTEDTIRDSLFKKAQHLDIPITRENIKVTRTGAAYSGAVSIEAPYTVHVDLIAYPVDLNFHPSTTNTGAFH